MTSNECATCEWPDVEVTDSDGAVDEGPFYEVYECPRCSSVGVIEGDAADPDTWRRSGGVFDS